MTGPLLGATAGLLLAPLLRLAAVRYAVPYGEPLRDACPACRTPLRLPAPTGRCRGCRERVGPAPWLPELAAVAAFGLLNARDGLPPGLVAVLWWVAAAGVALGFVDAAVHRLPDALTLPAFLGTAVLLTTAALLEGRPDVLLRCLAAAGAMGAFYGVLALVAPIGLGDAKLAPTLGAVLGWYGWGAVLGGLFLGFLLAGLWGAALLLTGRAGRDDPLPFGPFMLLGTLAALTAAA
ncbi:prepilin peptidase [Kitasatospora sp. NPDC054939]